MKRSQVLILLSLGIMPLWVMGAFALLGAAALMIGGQVVGGALAQRGAGKAAGAAREAGQLQYDASMAALDLQREMYETGRQDMAPWLSAGTGALAGMQSMLGLPAYTQERYEISPGIPGTPGTEAGFRDPTAMEQFTGAISGMDPTLSALGRYEPGTPGTPGTPAEYGYRQVPSEAAPYEFTETPGYQFRLQEGMQQMQNMMSARGMRDSGAAIKAGQRYGQEYASGEWEKAYNRLAGLAGTGQTTGAQMGQIGAGYAPGMANMMQAGGGALAGGVLGAGQARASAYQGMGQNIMDIGGDIGNMMMMNRLMGGGGGVDQTQYWPINR